MLDQLIQLDHQFFFSINHGVSNPFFDWLMPVLRDRYTWIPLYVVLVVYFIRAYGLSGLILAGFLVLTFAATDTLSSRVIKQVVARERPCNDALIKDQVNNLVDCGTGYSFPSSHAANHFGVAIFLTMIFYRKGTWIMPAAIFWAASICLAQVYVGVHYPFDVISGAIFGSVIGYLFALLYRSLQFKYKWKPGN